MFKTFDKIIEDVYSNKFRHLGYVGPWWVGKIQSVVDLWLLGQLGAPTTKECRANARRVGEEHYEKIRSVTPEGR